ncbi:MAG TPA: potassium transporter TrkG [Gemmatimonadaceae bacterium]|nr:potassium transporter TrkG [Gemmatimonadaceae bacterium]
MTASAPAPATDRRRRVRWLELGGRATRTGLGRWRRLTAPQLFVVSFAALVAVGTLALRLLPGLYTGARLGWLDALFTATSAACVTGLVVVDTATHFTFAGQAVLLLLIQLGGLGMITFTTVIILTLGRRISLRAEALTHGTAADVAPDLDVSRLGRDVFRFTFGFEAVGALLLYMFWIPDHGWSGAIWPAVFHSVSAFCNAGFSVFSDSMIGQQRAPAVLLTVMGLIVVGGLGFLTLEEFAQWRRVLPLKRRFRLSIHSRLVLLTTAVLIAGGWVAFAAFEWHNTLAGLPVAHRIVNALFLSVTPRTAGFNSIDYGAATESTNFLTIILMFIGGSPGSTAGGIKTTTFILIGLLALSRMRGSEIVNAWQRSVPEETIQRAVGLTIIAFTVITAGIFALTWTESAAGPGAAGGGSFLSHMFEAASAFNTVGLSMNVTPTLSGTGRVLMALLMFIGRVGPLTFAAALALRRDRSAYSYRYANEDVVVG